LGFTINCWNYFEALYNNKFFSEHKFYSSSTIQPAEQLLCRMQAENMAINAFWIRTAAALPVLVTTALAGQRPQGIELSIRQRTVTMVANATNTFSAQEKPLAQVGPPQLFDQRLVNLQWSVVTQANAVYLYWS
jgi:hypothetical protein